MVPRGFTVFTIFVFAVVPHIQGYAINEQDGKISMQSSPFETALVTLQNQIGYKFKKIGLLWRAMTHASFAEISILFPSSRRETEVSMILPPKMLSALLFSSEISKVESSCATDGLRLGLHKVVRVSSKTNSSAPVVVCGAFRAIFGAVALDVGKSDDAGSIFWAVHGGEVGGVMAF